MAPDRRTVEPMIIAVAGATGVAGRHVVEVAGARGHRVVLLARSLGIDLTTGHGVDAALTGVDAVVDVTGTATQKAATSEQFFGSITRTLQHAERAAGVGHHVALSIVGIDDIPLGYYAGKLLQEQLVSEGDVAWSIQRATQFHEFAEQALGFVSIGPFSVVPQMASQTIAAVEVAEQLIDLVEAGPSGRVPDLAGPEENHIVDLARRFVRSRGLRRRVISLSLPGAAGRAMRAGALRPHGPGSTGTLTFDEWISRA